MKVSTKIRKRIRREFFPDDYAEAIQILKVWNTKECAPGEMPGRMHTAVLNCALGNVSWLKHYIKESKMDFRDVLLWGEYEKSQFFVECDPGEREDHNEAEVFLSKIYQAPDDNTIRLIYADWLEEHYDSRGEYVRVLCSWLDCHPKIDAKIIEEEGELREGITNRWLALIRGMPVQTKQ